MVGASLAGKNSCVEKTYAVNFYGRHRSAVFIVSLKFLPFFCPASKNMVATLVCKKCNVRRLGGFLFCIFSSLALAVSFICSFALMQKNQKIKALMPSLKMDCVPLKCPNSPLDLRTGSKIRFGSNSGHFLTLHFIHFLNAHASMPVIRLRPSNVLKSLFLSYGNS